MCNLQFLHKTLFILSTWYTQLVAKHIYTHCKNDVYTHTFIYALPYTSADELRFLTKNCSCSDGGIFCA